MSENPYEKYYLNPEDSPVVAQEEAVGTPTFNYAENDCVPEKEEDFTQVYTKPESDILPSVPCELGSSAVHSPTDSEQYLYTDDVRTVPEDSASCEWNGNGNLVAARESLKENPTYNSYSGDPLAQKNKNKRTPVSLILLLCMIISAVFGGGSAYLVNFLNNKKLHSDSGLTIHQVSPDSQSGDYTTAGELSTVEVVDKYADSVVEIVTETVTTGVFSQQFIQSGAGSGVIIDSKGYIVTNHHVIEGARKISVTLRNGKNYSAKMVGSDAKEDLALLKIEAENLTTAIIGNSDALKVGQRTIAIGNPLGQLGGTVTEGIISALDRELVVDGQSMNLMQTDTAINPGNSGGGMFDGKGNLIGVVVAKSSGSEVEGLGFAIPINDALVVVSDLMEYGYVRGRVDIGIEFIDISSEAVAWMYGLSETGCYVYEVDRNTNAEEAGFRSGDLVLKVDGKDVKTSEDIEKILEDKKVGDKVEFSIKRGSSMGKVTLELEEDIPDTIKNIPEDDDLIEWYNFG